MEFDNVESGFLGLGLTGSKHFQSGRILRLGIDGIDKIDNTRKNMLDMVRQL